MSRAFSANDLELHMSLGRCPRLEMKIAPLALNKCNAGAIGWLPNPVRNIRFRRNSSTRLPIAML